MIRRSLLLIIVFLTASACSDGPEKPDNLIPEDKYVNLLVEMQMVRSYSISMQLDSLGIDSMETKVYHHYGVNRKQFMASHRYYQYFPKKQKKRIDEAIERLKKDQVKEKPEKHHEIKPPLFLKTAYFTPPPPKRYPTNPFDDMLKDILHPPPYLSDAN